MTNALPPTLSRIWALQRNREGKHDSVDDFEVFLLYPVEPFF